MSNLREKKFGVIMILLRGCPENAPKENYARLGLGIGLGLQLRLGKGIFLEGNYPRTFYEEIVQLKLL